MRLPPAVQCLAWLLFAATSPAQTAASRVVHPRPSDTGDALNGLIVASFAGSGTDSIQAMAADADGNIYITGTTSSPDFPVKNAAQPRMGESSVLRSIDRGATWTMLTSPPTANPLVIEPDPSSPLVLFVGGPEGIFKTNDGGQTWRAVYTMNAPARGVVSIGIDPGKPSRLFAIAVPGEVSSRVRMAGRTGPSMG